MNDNTINKHTNFDGILNGLDEVRSDINSVLHLLQTIFDLEEVHEYLEYHNEEYAGVSQPHTLNHECENLFGTLDMLERIRSDVQEMGKAWAIACEELDAHEHAIVKE